MKLDEWHAVLETEPATPNQVGAIMAEFRRLGFAGRYDRTERLAASAALLELGELDSMRDLVMGDAGRLLRMLQRFRDRAGLNAAGSRRALACGPSPRDELSRSGATGDRRMARAAQTAAAVRSR